MTLAQLKSDNPGVRLVAMANHSNGLTLYAGHEPLPWPTDWPSHGLNGAWIESQGIEILR